MWENGSCELKNSELGVTAVAKPGMITQSYFVMELQVSARHLSGNENYFRGRIERVCVSANKPRYQFTGSG